MPQSLAGKLTRRKGFRKGEKRRKWRTGEEEGEVWVMSGRPQWLSTSDAQLHFITCTCSSKLSSLFPWCLVSLYHSWDLTVQLSSSLWENPTVGSNNYFLKLKNISTSPNQAALKAVFNPPVMKQLSCCCFTPNLLGKEMLWNVLM